MAEPTLVFNGVDVATGRYLTPPVALAGLAEGIRAERPAGSHLRELRRRRHDDEEHLGVLYGRDPNQLGSAPWGLVVPTTWTGRCWRRWADRAVAAGVRP